MIDESYRRAIAARGRREWHARGWPIRVFLVRRMTRPDFRRRYIPAMATPNSRQWWTIAYWHRLQVGPLIVLWRTRSKVDR